jgi:hypothetical protein
MATQTMIKVSTNTRDRLARFKYSKGFRSFEDAIADLLKEHEEKESYEQQS